MLRRGLVVGLVVFLLVPLSAAAAASAPQRGHAAGATGTPSVTASPDTDLQNQQVITVNWSGFTPTSKRAHGLEGYFDDEVGIFECVAKPPDGNYYYYRDCYTQLTAASSQSQAQFGGNMVDPASSQNLTYGQTAPSGTGFYNFQVLAGTLHTEPRSNPCTGSQTSGCNPAYDLQCDSTHACVLKVVDFGSLFATTTVPNPTGSGETQLVNPSCTKQPCKTYNDWTYYVDHAPSIPLSFAPFPSCPPISAGNTGVSVEGAVSASYALEAWAADLCEGAKPVTINYSQVGEALAKSDLAAGNTDVAVASLSPTAPGFKYLAAPLDAAGVAIAFNIDDSVTGLPITTLRLTPRLVAMLVTNSATFTSFSEPQHTTVNGTTYGPQYALTNDPEFLALNPGFHWPIEPGFGNGVVEPLLPGGLRDDAEILTRWFADDKDTLAFLSGHDVCGAPLNQWWSPANVHYPAPQFLDLEHGGPGGVYGDFYNPLESVSAIVTDLLYGRPAGFNPPAGLFPGGPLPPVRPSRDALFAVMDSVTARRSGFSLASLLPADPTGSELADFVNESGGTCTPKSLTSFPGFVAPDNAGFENGYAAMTANPDGTLAPPVATTAADAYPLAKIDYAFVPASGLPRAVSSEIASMLDFTATAGQLPSNLPAGYTPLPAALASQTIAVAKQVAAEQPATSPPGTSPGGSARTGGPGGASTSHGSTSSPATGKTGSAGSGQPAGGGTASAGVAAPSGPASHAFQAAAFVGAGSSVSGGWLLPVVAVLAVVLGVSGGALRWDAARKARRKT